MSERIVVTGMGVVTPIGSTVATFWSALLSGHCGVRDIDGFEVSDLGTRFAGQVDDADYHPLVPAKVRRRVDRFVAMALAAAVQAAGQSGLDEKVDPARLGVCVGTSAGPLATNAEASAALAVGGAHELRRRLPYLAASGSMGGAAAEIARALDARGPSLTVSTECSSGANAIGLATALLRARVADVMVCGASDATVTRLSMASMSIVGALSERNDAPSRACRPFDADRDGFVLGEGSAMLVLETETHARRRGVQPLAEVLGFGAATDIAHATAPDADGRGAVAAMHAALVDADLESASIDLFSAHATGTRLNDPVELDAFRAVFADDAPSIPIYGIKPLTGHTVAAAGAIEAVALILSLREGVVPATANCDDPIDRELDIVRGENRRITARRGMSTSFGFGGQCAALVLAASSGLDDTGATSSRGGGVA
ncbi:beta-ketoacyl-[acyl-carrier-protein] synthase family protein [Microbacterium sp. SL75]|uniref:beta-ketoacyl-[acyl-carrier-protein] synthase family protein n=1 Tax=Microbacterium sp. SL75 TaxID=2995140 RepID=UPI00227125AF|nr:beta-ketoacyl-[acyl-carrier-protein] synthase family protein [Microbacterium sp. SL75]WAC69272.1 beta-ketoacyl-[acyl-carrier-protein] synthase family protein [Microbacterium sp. SL75]